MKTLIILMIALGSILMLTNIVRYRRFTKHMGWMGKNAANRLALYTPLGLLVLFLAGYIAVGLFGSPDMIMAGILFGGSIFVSIILNLLYFIVERVQHDARLQEALADARAASEAKTVFFSNMSHDLRTPMNAIIGYTQLARRPGTTEAQMREYLEKIDSSGKYLLALINDVLEMSRIESGRLDLEEERTDLAAVMQEARDMFASQMEERQLAFTVTVQPLCDPVVWCDRHRLNRVLMNLLSNACKFTPPGGSVTLTLAQTGRTEGGGTYELRAADTGIGMSREFAGRIFDAFERERNSTVSGIQGTGLGMAITKSIIDRMGGEITVESEPGKGTVFTIRLTLRSADAQDGTPCPAAEKEQEQEQTAPAPGHFAGHRLLLAEDNAINREIAEHILTEAGFVLDTAVNGEEALALLTAAAPGTYSAVLMDVQMPVMDGCEATRRIRALPDPQRSRIPVIAMTANAFREDIEKERAAGMDAHITKPVNVRSMLETLRQVLPE